MSNRLVEPVPETGDQLALSELPLPLIQQSERLQGSEPVDVQVVQLLHHRWLLELEEGHLELLGLSRDRFWRLILLFEFGKDFAGALQHRRGNTGHSGDVDSVGAISPTGENLVGPDDL